MNDMTRGSAYRHLWQYALPLMLGNWFQLAYNAADSIIVGQFIGKDALAAEGAAAPVMNLVILAISGVTIGAGVLMSEFFGARDGEQLRRELATTLLAGACFSLAVAVLGILFTPQILRWQAVPDDIFAITMVYLRITFVGAPFTCFYNALAAGLKSVGDAKTPLRFLIFSSVLNVMLDLVLIGALDFGIACSAATTVFAQGVSALLAAVYLVRRLPELCPRREEWRIDRPLLGRTMRYGSVTALQQACQPIGKVLIQGQVNLLGVDVMAAYNAVTRMDDFACIPEQSVAQGITTFIAQNRGARRYARIRAGFRAGLLMEFGYWILIGSITALFRTPIVSLFVSGEGAEQVTALGSQYLAAMTVFYILPAFTNGFQGYYRGMGRMGITLAGTLIQTSLRVVFTVLLAPRMGIYGIAFACAGGWIVMLLFEIPLYFLRMRGREGEAAA
ncbi:MATE family efflux transporter [uncultured Gemmiger sp.]|uniref:MATE family efflux transporter n=1 Tax=uncultured Gemmiger sp. TaxID=1623490 RepID=UPI00345290D5